MYDEAAYCTMCGLCNIKRVLCEAFLSNFPKNSLKKLCINEIESLGVDGWRVCFLAARS